MEGKYNSAAARWAAVGPYYAMFPTSFADDVVAQFTEPGDWVLDPFAGRGTAVYSAAIAHRHGVGIELNPVGWLYGATKLAVAPGEAVEARLREIERAVSPRPPSADALPEFFTWCFSERVLAFLVTARAMLDWRASGVDRTLMALILVYLHGKHDASLSNQMRQTKAMAPRYAVNWWRERELKPPALDPGEFLRDRIAWRYARGVPAVERSHMFLGDCTRSVDGLASRWSEREIKPAKLLLTSPPYFKLTNYHYDQWLRLWLLGGPPSANRVPGTSDLRGKFESIVRYRLLLGQRFRRRGEADGSRVCRLCQNRSRRGNLRGHVAGATRGFPWPSARNQRQPYRTDPDAAIRASGVKVGEIDIILTST